MSARHSSDSSHWQVASVGSEAPNNNSFERTFASEHGESTLHNSQDKIEKAVVDLEDDWQNDPENARNWSTRKKWTAVCIVRRRLDLFFLFFFWVAYNFIFLSFRRSDLSIWFRITSFQSRDGAWSSGNRHQIWDHKFDHYCFDAQHIHIVFCIRCQFSFALF